MNNSALQVSNRNDPGATNRYTVGQFFRHQARWCIPVYQRHYAWDVSGKGNSAVFLCETILSNAEKIMQGKTVHPHYMGVIHVHEMRRTGEYVFNAAVVDGQQRLTTIQLSLLALLANIREFTIDVPDIKNDIEECLLIRDGRPTLDPNNFDRQRFHEVLKYATGQADEKLISSCDTKLTTIFKYFKSEYEIFINNHENLEQRAHAVRDSILDNLELVAVNLRTANEAQEVFEHLNRYGKPLSTFDLIRNKVFYTAAKRKPGSDVDIYNSDAWKCLEDSYWEQEIDRTKVTRIESYMQNMLVVATKEPLGRDRESVVERYMDFQDKYKDSQMEVQDLVKYTGIYRYLENPDGPNIEEFPKFGLFSHKYKGDRVGRVLYPVMFMISDSKCTTKQKKEMAHILESFVVRRTLCGMKTADLWDFAVNACEKFGGNSRSINPNLLRDFFNSSDNSGDSSFIATFPDNKTLEKKSRRAKFYGYKVIGKFILYAIEKHLRGSQEFELQPTDDLTFDHILPKKWAGREEWVKIIGSQEEEADDCIDSIGNITLVLRTRNSRKSNKSWTDSKKILGESEMILNRNICANEKWGISEIEERRKSLIKIATKIWPVI